MFIIFSIILIVSPLPAPFCLKLSCSKSNKVLGQKWGDGRGGISPAKFGKDICEIMVRNGLRGNVTRMGLAARDLILKRDLEICGLLKTEFRERSVRASRESEKIAALEILRIVMVSSAWSMARSSAV